MSTLHEISEVGVTPKPSLLPAFGMLALTAFFGLLAVYGAPEDGYAIGVWPVALASSTLLVSRRPTTPVVLALVMAIAFLTIWTGRPPEVALGLAAGITAETWVVWRILTGGVRRRPELYTNTDLARYIVASTAGALVVVVATLVTSLATGWGDAWLLALAVGTPSLGSQLSVTPFFCRLRPHRGLAGTVERLAQWILIVTVTPVVFMLDDSPAMVFLLVPLLAWGAMRSGAYEAIAQLFTVLGIAIALTTRHHGPFAQVDARYDLPVDVQGVLLAAFIIASALVVVPFVLSVGEQLENARQTAAERDKVQRIVNGIKGVAIIGTDELGRVTLFNPGAERLLGYTADEVDGLPTRIFHDADGVAEKAAELGIPDDFTTVAGALIGYGPTDMKFVRKDGQVRNHSMSLNRVVDDRGATIGYVSTSEDITERVEAEGRLVEALETERQAVERLREVDQVKDAFVSSVSHELRTPITSILGYLEMLQDGEYGELESAQLAAVRRVASNSSRLLSLIDDLLTLSRLQEGGLGTADRLVDLRKVVAAACAVVAPSLEKRELVLEVDLPDEPVPFLGDRDMLERVVINLVGNAVKFTPEEGRVDVRLRVGSETVDVEVADTGIGIPSHEQDRLFSRFFRSSLAQERAIPGSGLGLSIAHAIVEQHGGSMSVESEPGAGTTFRVRLPILVPA
ncbi:ATP-binding protein [Nocardioides sp. YIM 152315]|uniref:ATP-binding protein n=1 Tax=Nocardioides sp. YIM 152315 TaxID=3031760 RepID=UPI0023DA8FEC|nr:ATP-binding protein [Nocardioides sp. YIM 152315]MDF1606417.1 ATP-binding protein [Nocardioides sp. YIM 152315]